MAPFNRNFFVHDMGAVPSNPLHGGETRIGHGVQTHLRDCQERFGPRVRVPTSSRKTLATFWGCERERADVAENRKIVARIYIRTGKSYDFGYPSIVRW